MTNEEFDRWWTRTAAALPSIGSWLGGLGEKDIDPRETLRSWRKILGDCKLEFANQAIDRIAAGDLDLGEWQFLPATVAKEAIRLEWSQKLSPARHTDGARVRCRLCGDFGYVSVLNVVCNSEGSLMMRGRPSRRLERGEQVDRAELTTFRTACSCDQGSLAVYDGSTRPEAPKGKHWIHRSAVYDPDKHLRVAYYIDDDVLAEFSEWREDVLDRWEARNREAVFDEYNRGAF